jgi:hypothetical protein
MTEFIRGAWTADLMILAPAASKTASNMVVKLASRSWSTNFTRAPAQYGYCASHSRYFWGLRLHLVCTLHGLPVMFAIAGAKAGERRFSWPCWRPMPRS